MLKLPAWIFVPVRHMLSTLFVTRRFLVLQGSASTASTPVPFIAEIITKQSPAVFILMTVNTQVFPVGTIRRIIPRISIFMVYSQEMPVFIIKFPRTFGTDKPVYLQ